MFQGMFIDTFDSDKKLAELMSTAGRHGLRINWQKPVELMKLANHIFLVPTLLLREPENF